MKRWFKLLVVLVLGLSLSLGYHQVLKAQILPSQIVRQAQIYYETGKFDRAIELLNKANLVYLNQRKYLQQAQVLTLTSLAHQQLGQWDKAQQNITDSHSLIKSIPASPNKTQVLAQIWSAKGHFQYEQGNEREALSNWQEAEKLYSEIDDKLGVSGSLIDRAQALEKMGFYRRSCNLVLAAFAYPDLDCQNLTSPQLTSIVKQQAKSTSNLRFIGLSSIGDILLSMGKLSQSQVVIESIEADYADLLPINKAKILFNSGNIHKAIALRDKERDDLPSFINHSRKAIADYQAIANQKLQLPITDTYRLPAQLNHLSLLTVTQQWSEAQKLANQIDLDSADKQKPDLYTQVKLAHNLALIKQQIALKYSWQDLADIYLRVIKQAQETSQQRIQSYALGYLGKLQLEQNIRVDATPKQLIEQALILAQAIDAPEIAYRWQWQLGQIYHQQNDREEAIAFYDAALGSLKDLRTDLVSLTKEIQFGFKEQIEPVYREFADLLLEPESIADSEVKKALNVIEALQVAELDNYFQDACTVFEPKSIDQLDRDAAVIYTIVLPTRLEIIMTMGNTEPTSAGYTRRYTRKIPQSEIETAVRQLRQYIPEPDRVVDVQELSTQIYDWLIEPFDEDLAIKKPQTLVFVLDNVLQNIPMSALYDGEKYLIEKYAIALTPGLRLLNPGKNSPESTFLAGGISKTLQVAQQKFSALSNIESELDIFSEFDSQVLLNTNFTSENLLKQLNLTSASIVHIATHGQFSSNPQKTFLLLWQQLLTMGDFSNLLLRRQKATSKPIDLLVLSACNTATGDRRAALGLAGIAVRSGANSTIATLWQVNDDSTAQLMDNFYQQIAQNKNKAEALRQAQLQLWQTPGKDWKVPAFWSPYIIIGNWR